KRGSTEDISSAPFHTGFVSGFLWLHYGILKEDRAVLYVNAVSSSLYTFYLLYYCLKTPYPMKRRQLRFAAIEIIFLSLIHLYGEVIRSKTTKNLPLPLCIATLLVTSEWLLYGFLVEDIFIKFPNAIAVTISIAQIVPFAIYPRKGKISLSTKTN
uniref:Sugar transporter SWEET1 n=1 Tax=Parascaris equorum TaxID=6256 RepID=A0A914RD89_PAREQ